MQRVRVLPIANAASRVADLERQTALMALAQSDARALIETDPALTGPRGKAARVLLWPGPAARTLWWA